MNRFWEKVDQSGGPQACWPWIASIGTHGYGRFKHKGVTQNASRVAWQISTGLPAYRQVIRHTCDNPCCCNPAHLIVGSQADNMNDMVERGRQNPSPLVGEKNPRAKLTEGQVYEIRRRIAKGEGNRQIAKDFPVSDSLISRIRVGRSWVEGGGQ